MRPYESPSKKMRRMRAGGAGDSMPTPEMHDNDNPELDGPAPTPEAEAPQSGQPEGQDGFTAFLPKEITAGKTFKAGEEIVLKIKDIDPDTGELEVQYAPESPSSEQSPMEQMDAMASGEES